MSKENEELKKRIADLEEKFQNQQKELGQALAFLFDRSEYKELIKQGKAEWTKMLTEAINNVRTAQEVPVQEQQKITYDFGVLEPSKFYITTDKRFYEGAKENPKFVPMFTPKDFKENLGISMDSQLYIFRILQHKFVPEDSNGKYPDSEKCSNHLTCSDNQGQASLLIKPE